MTDADELNEFLARCSQEQRQFIFDKLREEFQIHPLEQELGTTAEVILEAIHRSSDLTIRGIRGVIAEASFVIDVVPTVLEFGWEDKTPIGDLPYDAILSRKDRNVRIQVKMQRKKDKRPMMANEGYRDLPSDHYVVEVQRTRGGTGADGSKTRPYRFGEFDLLAVSMQVSTGRWDSFMYAPATLLQPEPKEPNWVRKFQAVPPSPNGVWTNSLKDVLERV